MKRAVVIVAVVAVAGMAVFGAAYGPDLLEAYRFEKVFNRQVADYEADGGPWPQLQDTCALCHGERGQSRSAQYASLAGLSARYIEAQMHAFAEGRRQSPHMGPLAANLSYDQIKMLAAYYAQQKPERNDIVVADADLDLRGQAAVIARNCSTCHGNRLSGGPLGPRLAGQGKAYLADQLAAFKSGERQDSTRVMNELAGAMSEKEIIAIAHYLAGLEPVSNSLN